MELDLTEALRYGGVSGTPDGALLETIRSCAEELTGLLEPQWVWRVFPLRPGPEGYAAQGAALTLPGGLAASMLEGCSHAALMVCTLGRRFDTLLRAAEARDLARAVLLDACGSAYVESGCGGAEKEIAERFPEKYRTDRFSPGYGDFPLTLQRQICAVLDADRRLGVTVTDSLMLIPAKTVTAVIGLADAPRPARIRGCASCALRENCEYRKGGNSCEI